MKMTNPDRYAAEAAAWRWRRVASAILVAVALAVVLGAMWAWIVFDRLAEIERRVEAVEGAR